jgi:hypothetical protein
MAHITPQDLRIAFLDGVFNGVVHADSDGEEFPAPRSVEQLEFRFSDLASNEGFAEWITLSQNVFPDQPVRVPQRVILGGIEYGWVGDALYSRREIDIETGTEPRLVTFTIPTPQKMQRLLEIHGQTEFVAHSPEALAWANLLI